MSANTSLLALRGDPFHQWSYCGLPFGWLNSRPSGLGFPALRPIARARRHYGRRGRAVLTRADVSSKRPVFSGHAQPVLASQWARHIIHRPQLCFCAHPTAYPT